jgi:YidC/Oxa1 family membrane protein insertase
MANFRPALIITLVFLGYLMWVEWQKDYGPKPLPTPAAHTAPVVTGPSGLDLPSVDEAATGDLPTAGAVPTDDVPGAVAETAGNTRERLLVVTDVLELEIDPVGGSIVTARLLNYPVDLDAPGIKVALFHELANDIYVAQSGLLSRQPAPNHTTPWQHDRAEYRLADGADELVVPLTWSDASGVRVTKQFVLKRGQYNIAVSHVIDNGSSEAWSGSRYLQLQRTRPSEEGGSGFNNPERYSFKGLGFYSPADKLVKVDFEDVAEEPYAYTGESGWLSMIQHYFFTAWIPPGEETAVYSTQQLAQDSGRPRVIARAVSPLVSVAPGQAQEFTSTLYAGPKLQDELEGVAPGLALTVNYGIFTVISAPLFWLLEKIHDFVGNWGWAIVLLTVLIKLGFFKLTEAQYKSMARMRKLQPRIEKLKERYGDDRQAMSQAMMAMYKEEKVNPLGGCLPILVQIPIFIALYWVLLESVELRQAPFMLWIDNLSVRDPYFVLPLLNAGFMIMTQRLTPTAGMDPMQAKMMQAMPIVFAVMFACFPAGLVLYWATNAGLSLAQQWYITRKIAAAP